MNYTSSFIQYIRLKEGGDPFSLKFDKNKLKKEANSHDDIALLNSLIWLHYNIFKPLFNNVLELIDQSDLSYSDLTKYTIAFLNYETHFHTTQFDEMIKKSKEFNPLELNDGVYENIVDLMDFLLKFYVHVPSLNEGEKKSSFSPKKLESAQGVLHLGNCCFEFNKHCKNSVWTGGEIVIESGKVYFNIGDHSLLKSRELGIKSIQNDILSSLGDVNIGAIDFNTKLRRFKQSPFIAESINFTTGKHITLRRRRVDESGDVMSQFYAFSGLYSAHTLNVKLPSLYNLTTEDCALIYSEIHHLFLLFNFPNQSYDVNSENLKEFLPKIRVKDLEEYLNKMLPHRMEEIVCFLNKCIYKPNNGDTHIFPLIKIDKYAYFSFNHLQRSSLHIMIDHWIKIGEIDNRIKGSNYEHQVKDELNFEIKNQNRNASIIPVRKMKNIGDFDLILRVGNNYFVAELKGLRYAASSHSYYKNYFYDDIQTASQQLNDRKAYIANNANNLPYELIGMTIQNTHFIIITNFPSYNGMKIGDFPIISHETLFCYFRTDRMKFLKKGLDNVEVLKEEMYYSNEIEFSENLKRYLEYPPFYVNGLRNFKVEKITYSINSNLPNIEYDYAIYVD